MAQMLDAEMTARVGPKHAKIQAARRTGTGRPPGRSWLVAARWACRGPGDRPSRGKIELESWAALSSGSCSTG